MRSKSKRKSRKVEVVLWINSEDYECRYSKHNTNTLTLSLYLTLTRVESVSWCVFCFASLNVFSTQLEESDGSVRRRSCRVLRLSDSPAVISAAAKQFFSVCDLSFIRQRRKNLQTHREQTRTHMRNATTKYIVTVYITQQINK